MPLSAVSATTSRTIVSIIALHSFLLSNSLIRSRPWQRMVRASPNHQRPQQDGKRQHLERCPNGMPLFKSVQFGRQGHLIVRCVFDAEHHWGCPGRSEGVKDTRAGGNGKRKQQLYRVALCVGNCCGKKGEERCAYAQKRVDHPPIPKIVA